MGGWVGSVMYCLMDADDVILTPLNLNLFDDNSCGT